MTPMTLEVVCEKILALENRVNTTENRIGGFEEKFTVIHSTLNTQNAQLSDRDDMLKGVHGLSSDIKLIAQKMDHLTERVDDRMRRIEHDHADQEKSIKELIAAPGKKATAWWDKVIGQAVMSLISAGVSGALVYLLMR